MSQDVKVCSVAVANTDQPYADQDVVGGVYRLVGAVGPAGAVWKSIVVVDRFGYKQPVRLYLFDRPPAGTDNVQFNPTAAELDRLVGYAEVAAADFVTLSAQGKATAALEVSQAVNSDPAPDTAGQGPGDLWLVVVSDGGSQWWDADDVVVRLGFIRS